jgi:protein-S-isoprenylcysteine O-methyltransferase Ste14
LSKAQKRGIRKWIVQSFLGIIAYAAIIFLSAGRLDWTWGWALLAVVTCFMAAHPLLLIPRDPDLLVQRQQGLREPGVKAWDRVVTMLGAGVMPLASWVIGALDHRLGWTGGIPLAVHLIGLVINILGYAMFLWAMVSNAFFAEGVRVQEERGHTVATSGPYRWVRHPGYVGAILSQMATPFLLGSWWALFPSVASAMLYVIRTALEDNTLHEELPGYASFAERTRHRLIPGIW